jgi:hypothetical protein
MSKIVIDIAKDSLNAAQQSIIRTKLTIERIEHDLVAAQEQLKLFSFHEQEILEFLEKQGNE